MSELKPCPFCGGEAKLYSIGTGSPHYGHYHQVVCQGCLTASGAYWSGEQSAIDAWNTRVDEGGNYEKLFGTPEKAAHTLSEIKCGDSSCWGCPLVKPCGDQGVLLDDGKALCASLLEWLRSDAE